MGSSLRARGKPTAHSAVPRDTVAADAFVGGEQRPAGSIGPLAQMVGYRLRRAQMAVFDDIIRRFASIELKPAQFSVLLVLDRTPGLSQSDVAAALGIQRANFVGLIDLLERRGLAVRQAAPSDRRSHALHLTSRGREVLAAAQELQAEHEAWARAKLGPDGYAALLGLLGKLAPDDS